jgi:hypothetical protein
MAVAFAAAYLLVLQSVFGAFAAGMEPNAAQLDAFGNIICTHEGTAERPGDDKHQKHMPACCVLGCAMASSALGTPPDTDEFQTKLSFQAIVFQFWKPERLALERDRSPANPRAPPAA